MRRFLLIPLAIILEISPNLHAEEPTLSRVVRDIAAVVSDARALAKDIREAVTTELHKNPKREEAFNRLAEREQEKFIRGLLTRAGNIDSQQVDSISSDVAKSWSDHKREAAAPQGEVAIQPQQPPTGFFPSAGVGIDQRADTLAEVGAALGHHQRPAPSEPDTVTPPPAVRGDNERPNSNLEALRNALDEQVRKRKLSSEKADLWFAKLAPVADRIAQMDGDITSLKRVLDQLSAKPNNGSRPTPVVDPKAGNPARPAGASVSVSVYNSASANPAIASNPNSAAFSKQKQTALAFAEIKGAMAKQDSDPEPASPSAGSGSTARPQTRLNQGNDIADFVSRLTSLTGEETPGKVDSPARAEAGSERASRAIASLLGPTEAVSDSRSSGAIEVLYWLLALIFVVLLAHAGQQWWKQKQPVFRKR